MLLARTAVVSETFRRRTEIDLQLVASSGGLGRRAVKRRGGKPGLTAEGVKPRAGVADEDYDSYDDSSDDDGSDDEEEEGAALAAPPPSKKERDAAVSAEKKATKKAGKPGKAGKKAGKA